jgi:ABC-type Fe3+/spermidine/putrescine transport system ATPase subunit
VDGALGPHRARPGHALSFAVTTPYLALDGLSKRFDRLAVLDQVSLAVGEGEVLALLGPSGSGKTTLLRLLAGFDTADAGSIRLGERDVTALPAVQRGFGMVFQHYALFPHLTVFGNVAFGLESRGEKDPATLRQRVAEALHLADLEGFESRRIGELSGGQQQRVALARALAPRPRLLLLDEPLSNLDPTLRERTRRELRKTIERVGITTVLVTHEQEEAFDLGDRVAVLWRGRLQQVGPPEELYLEPANRFVATFVGRSSLVPGTVRLTDHAGRVWVRLAHADGPVWGAAEVEGLHEGDAVELAVRPEALRLLPAAERPAEGLVGTVAARRYGGAWTSYLVAVGLGGGVVEVEVLAAHDAARVGDAVALEPRPEGPRPRAFRVVPG